MLIYRFSPTVLSNSGGLGAGGRTLPSIPHASENVPATPARPSTLPALASSRFDLNSACTKRESKSNRN